MPQENNTAFKKSDVKSLSALLDNLVSSAEGTQITFGQIVEKFKYRGFGPLLLAPTFIVILPTGAIPFVPALAGLVIAFVCIQMLLGREHPWLPKRLREFGFSKTELENIIKSAKPYTKIIDKILHKRFGILINPFCKRLTAAISLLLCSVMVFIGFIPMFPATLALPIFFFALGYVAEDGLMIAIGFLTIIGSAAGLSFLMNLI